MKTLLNIIILTIIFALTSCGGGNSRNITFDSQFPKRNKSLANILGDKLTIKSGEDTLIYKITSSKNNNLIINSKTRDTVFFGTVSKFRGLYYFNEQLNDSSYWIYAVKISDNLIYGLNTESAQREYVYQEIKNGNNRKLIKYINSDTSVIRLHPEKRELKKLFSSIISNFLPDTILNYQETYSKIQDATSTLTVIDPEDFNYISKAYPNPTKDILNLELQQKSKSTFQLTDLSGKIVLQGQLNELINKIDISKHQAGVYALTIVNTAEEQKETIKIIKTE
jgi:hypothetical protein